MRKPEIRQLQWLVFWLMSLSLGACSTTQVDLPYEPPQASSVTTANPVIEMGSVADQRKTGSHYLGAVRGGYGNPLKTLETEAPVADVVKAAFQAGLKSRRLAASQGAAKYYLNVTIVKFDCSQYVRRRADANFRIQLMGMNGNVEYEHSVVATEVDGSLLTLETGVFGSVEDLRKIANELLQRVVDQALDDPGLLAHLRGSQPSTTG